jgi:hypothetical protein
LPTLNNCSLTNHQSRQLSGLLEPRPRLQTRNQKNRPAAEYLEHIRKTMGSETLTVAVRLRPGESDTLSAEEVAKRIVVFWDLPSTVRSKLVFGGWRTREEVAQATDEEMLQTKDTSSSELRSIRKSLLRERRAK